MRRIATYAIPIAAFLAVACGIFALGNGISELKVEDSSSSPLIPGDSGITFLYRTTSLGTVSAYLKTPSEAFRLFADFVEFKGEGTIILSPSLLMQIAGLAGYTSSNLALDLTHVAARTHAYSETVLPLTMWIDAPFGYELQDLPPEPKTYPTNLTKTVVRPLPAVGEAAADVVLLGCISLEVAHLGLGLALDPQVEKNIGTALVVSLVTAVICHNYSIQVMPDEDLNDTNRRINAETAAKWQQDCNDIQARNELVKLTFKIRIGKT